MKKVKVMVATPSVGQCKFLYANNLAQLFGYYMSAKVFPEGESQAIEFSGIEGSGVSSARETFINRALADDFTHLLFIDEDMMFPKDGLHQLLRRRQDIVGANYRKRLPPGDWLAVDLDKKGRVPTDETKSGLEAVHYTGFGFCLLSRKAMEAVTPPRFMLEWIPEANGYTTEDVIWFTKARDAGLTAYIDHDLSKHIGHIGMLDYRWDQDYSNIKTSFNPAISVEKPVQPELKVVGGSA